MRFRTELLPVLPVLVAASAALPLEGCKKEDKPASSVDGGSKPPIVIRKNDDIPIQLGGAPMPYNAPEPPPPAPNDAPQAPQAPAPRAPAPGAPPPGAAAPAAAAPAPAAPGAIALVHNHPPNQPCHPLTRGEVEKALSDLQNKSR